MRPTGVPQPTHRFQILSLDGGGIKGVFTAALLAAIEDDLKITIVDHFDLIAGTSTGGIIALGLGLGLSPREILRFYLEHGGAIFPNAGGTWNKLRHHFTRKYSHEPLQRALKDSFKDKLFGHSTKRLVIPSYNLGDDDVYIFRTPHHERLRRDYKIPAWKVASATSAAPTYFPSFCDIDSQRLIDGGMWANNPSMVALVEAYGPLGIPLTSIHLLSIGTTDEINDRVSTLDNAGKSGWASQAIDVAFRGQTIAARNQAKFLLGEQQFYRLDPAVARGAFCLDGVDRSKDLLAKAAHHSRHFAPVFQERFAGHAAPLFTPLYTQEAG